MVNVFIQKLCFLLSTIKKAKIKAVVHLSTQHYYNY